MADTPFVHNVAASVQHSQKSVAAQGPQLAKYSLQAQAKAPINPHGQSTYNLLKLTRHFGTLIEKARSGGKTGGTSGSKEAEKEEEAEGVERKKRIGAIDGAANEFSEKNEEFEKEDLLKLLLSLSEKDTKEDVLRRVSKMYKDPSLADLALDFLIEATEGRDLQNEIIAAKGILNSPPHDVHVRAGHNIGDTARTYSKKGLGTPSDLRIVYRDMIDNQRDAATLFQELTTLYPFEKMKQVIEFTLHAIGSDVNSKGPSIERGELHRLMTECRSMQAILGVYRFFKSQMGPIADEFKRQELALPMRLTFETLSKHYVTFLQDRYPSEEKVVKVLEKLGLGAELLGQVAVATRMRNACRNIAPKLFKSEQHRQDIIATFNATIAELDEKIEALMEEIVEEAEGEGFEGTEGMR